MKELDTRGPKTEGHRAREPENRAKTHVWDAFHNSTAGRRRNARARDAEISPRRQVIRTNAKKNHTEESSRHPKKER